MARPTVFVVDDDEAVLDSMKALLETTGFSVETYSSGLAFLESDAPRRDGCLLLDLHMPGLDGFEVQQQLKDDGFDLPIVVITAEGDVRMAVRAMQLGAHDFVEKPVSQDTILRSISRALLHHKEGSPRIRHDEAIFARLTSREREVMEQLVAGLSNKSIAIELGISPRTVEIHRARIMEKLQARNLAQLVRLAMTAGIISP